jgi:hypothetical protein
VDESKLRAVKDSSDDPSKIYGSPEDNMNALKSHSEMKLTEIQSRECIVSTIMNSIASLLDVIFTFSVASCVLCFNKVPFWLLTNSLLM